MYSPMPSRIGHFEVMPFIWARWCACITALLMDMSVLYAHLLTWIFWELPSSWVVTFHAEISGSSIAAGYAACGVWMEVSSPVTVCNGAFLMLVQSTGMIYCIDIGSPFIIVLFNPFSFETCRMLNAFIERASGNCRDVALVGCVNWGM